MPRRYFVSGLTKAQREAFELIATINRSPPAHPRTIAKLLDCGLIVRIADKVLGRDRFGEIRVPQYDVPIAIHMAWRQWCSEQPMEED